MKKRLIVLTSLSLTSVVHAQSSVTLFGIVDEAVEAVSNVKTSSGHGRPVYQMNGSSGLNGTRWGLRGQEDLGGGLKAVFLLENGFDPGTGKLNQGNDEFGREAFVGLTGDQWGALTVGRQYDSVVDFLGPLGSGEQWSGNRGSHPGDIDNFNDSYRANNSVKFRSLSYDGVTFEALYSFGGVAGSAAQNQIYSFGLGYRNGPLSLGAAYLNVRDPNISFFGNNASSGGIGTNNVGATNPVYGGYASANTYQVAGVGGAYAFGAATVGLTYTNIQFRGLGNTASAGPNPNGFTGNAIFNNAEVNFKYQLTPSLLAGVAYDYMHNGGASSTKAGVNGSGGRYNQFSLGVDYFLSRRTDLYAVGVYQIASGYDSTGQAATAELGSGLSGSGTGRQALLRLGIRHRF
ncbi:porin [Caballeronia sp. 15711]|uniref:porin n=1 Tax=Caballeronia sp. 15711 TaxID=3391029 RepID=UPI0039E278DA